MSELKPCPLCSDPMRWNTGGQLILHVSQNPSCPLGDLAFPEHRLAAWNTRPQPTASVDAEQVWREAYTSFNVTIATTTGDGNQTAAAVIQAYGDARADAARREALEEATRELAMRLVLNVENWPTEYFKGFDDARSAVVTLKENPNAG